jgi:bacteriorhodopsin
MLALSVVATILLSISIFLKLTSIAKTQQFDLAIFFNIFAIVTIWVLYANL